MFPFHGGYANITDRPLPRITFGGFDIKVISGPLETLSFPMFRNIGYTIERLRGTKWAQRGGPNTSL